MAALLRAESDGFPFPGTEKKGYIFGIQGSGNRLRQVVRDFIDPEQCGHPVADVLQRFPVIIGSHEEGSFNKALNALSHGIEEKHDQKGKCQGQRNGMRCAAFHEEDIEKIDDKDIEGGQKPRQDEIDRSLSYERSHVEQVIFQDAHGENAGREKAQISHGVDIESRNGEEVQHYHEGGQAQPHQDIFDTIALLVVGGLYHTAVEGQYAVEYGTPPGCCKYRIGGSRLGDNAEGVFMKPGDEEAGLRQGEERGAEEIGRNFEPAP